MPLRRTFCHGQTYSRKGCPELAEALQDYPHIASVSEEHITFQVVGAMCVAGEVVVVFPKSFGVASRDDATLLSDAKLLVRVLIRYRHDRSKEDPSPLEADERDLVQDVDNVRSQSVVIALALLEDYCLHGLLHRRDERLGTMRNGLTDWPATINKTLPIFTEGGPLYASPIVRHRVADEKSLLRLIHLAVVSECMREWGWFCGYDDYVANAMPLPVAPQLAVQKLEHELRRVYVERDIRVIKMLLAYLREKHDYASRHRLKTLAIKSFAAVWENACSSLLANRYPQLKGLLPQPKYATGYICNRPLSQRPDIFYVHGDSLFIVDAKDYDYASNPPGWPDAVKQFFYRHTLQGEMSRGGNFRASLPNVSAIHNVFVLPSHEYQCKCIGRIHVPDHDALGEIVLFAVDVHKTLATYVHDETEFSSFVQSEIAKSFSDDKGALAQPGLR